MPSSWPVADDYSAQLARSGVAHRSDSVWARVSNPVGTQGWKLHLSSTPTDGGRLLAAVLEVLLRRKLVFKVARDAETLERLNGGRLGPTQIGKFITVYPPREVLVDLARELVTLTAAFDGPSVPTDRHLGGVVYARFGPFAPLVVRDRLGVERLKLRLPDGTLVDDEYRVPCALPAGVDDPFGVDAPAAPVPDRRLGPGYLVTSVLQPRTRGSIFLALPLQAGARVAVTVIKQGRRLCLSDRYGRDIRWRLRREAAINAALAATGAVAPAREYFEADGDGYLALDYVAGQSFESFCTTRLAGRCWADLPAAERAGMLGAMAAFVGAVRAVHAGGYVHRDLSTHNVWVKPDGGCVLLDLEMAHRVGDDEPAVGWGTPGFIGPRQARGEPPDFQDDVYSVGCMLAFGLTGIDPRRLLHAGVAGLAARLDVLTGGAPELAALTALVARAVDPGDGGDASLAQLESALFAAAAGPPAAPRRAAGNDPAQPEPLLRAALLGLCAARLPGAPAPWHSLPIASTEADTVEELVGLRSAYRGVAGVVYVLARAVRMGYGTAAIRESLHAGVAFLAGGAVTPDAGLPGLHFGEAGVAIALREAAGAACEAAWVPASEPLRLREPPDWLDLTHGAAGQGLAALACGATDMARECAAFLVRHQDGDGSWRVLPGIADLSGQRLTGFAHGVAGIVYFLITLDGRHPGDAAISRAWQAGLAWLTARAVPGAGGRLEWPYSASQAKPWPWWCHGGPGIALTYLRAAEATGDERHLDIARRALAAHPPRVRHPNLGLCHGLAGLGEVYLEAHRVSGDPGWRERALDICATLAALGRAGPADERSWLTDHPAIATADLYVGSAGIAHFLLRVCSGPAAPGFPMLA